MKTLFVDTNLFLQCIDISQINWVELDISEDITLIISSPVQEEIDRLKSDGNLRRARKARKANSYLKNIILSEEEEVILSDETPKVILKFSPVFNFKIECNLLNLDKVDDQIIFEALNYEKAFDLDTAILTHDTNPLLTARRVGLKYKVIPDSWLLNVENSKKDKEVIKLKERITLLEKNKPNLEIECKIDNEIITEVKFEVGIFEKLQQNDVSKIIDLLRDFYPLRSKKELIAAGKKNTQKQDESPFLNPSANSLFHSGRKFVAPKVEDVEKYINKDYPNWIKNIEEFLRESHKANIINSFSQISLYLSNNGYTPAESVLVEIVSYSGVELLPNDCETKDTHPDFPVVPTEPIGYYCDSSGHFIPTSHEILKDYGTPVNRQNRDKNSFFWKDRKPNALTDSYEFTCEEFRHQLESIPFHVTLNTTNSNINSKSNLKVRVSCSNLSKPIIKNIPIKLVKSNKGLADILIQQIEDKYKT